MIEHEKTKQKRLKRLQAMQHKPSKLDIINVMLASAAVVFITANILGV